MEVKAYWCGLPITVTGISENGELIATTAAGHTIELEMSDSITDSIDQWEAVERIKHEMAEKNKMAIIAAQMRKMGKMGKNKDKDNKSKKPTKKVVA